MDKKAKDILFKTYWSSGGWKNKKYTAPEDFAYAKEKGVMFDPLTISHDDCVKRVIALADAITAEQAAGAFLSSLSTRRLDWRSAIASYSIAKLFTPHHYTSVEPGIKYIDGDGRAVYCSICRKVRYGVYAYEQYINKDLNVLNFERIKWGGIRHGELLYTLFDLEQFAKEEIPEPTEMDIEIFKQILCTISSCAPGDYPGALRDKLKDISMLQSNKDERAVLIEILACIQVLKSASFDRPTTGKNDWRFAEFWRGEDGYNEEIVEQYFGKYLR